MHTHTHTLSCKSIANEPTPTTAQTTNALRLRPPEVHRVGNRTGNHNEECNAAQCTRGRTTRCAPLNRLAA
eukprot:6631500-Lingulodinium_polyedra.AAC.1